MSRPFLPSAFCFLRSSRSLRRGFTLAELVMVIAILAVMAGVFFLVTDPAGQLAQSRNTKRSLDLETIMNSIRQTIVDQGNEQFNCSSGPVPTSTKNMGSASGSYNIAPCLVPMIVPMPFDPSASSSHYASASNYSTGYSIVISSTTGRITLSAPYAELHKTISITR
jgi:prepilin-type N-terminal cleavage/methylation domain-containing protein